MPQAQKRQEAFPVPPEAAFPRLTLFSSSDTLLHPLTQWALFSPQQEEAEIFIALGCHIDRKQANSQMPPG